MKRAVRDIALCCAALAGAVPPAPADDDDAVLPAAAYEREILERESIAGAFDIALREPLLALGLARRAEGDHRAAQAAFERALQLERRQDGLYSLGQLPLIELIVAELIAVDDQPALDRYYAQLDWLYRRNFRDRPAEQLAAKGALADRRIDAYRAGAGAAAATHLVSAGLLADRALQLALQTDGVDPAVLHAAFRRSVLVSYHVAADAADTSRSFGDLRAALSDAGQGVFEIEEAQAREEIFRRNFLRGEYHIERLVDAAAADRATQPLAYAGALVLAGDYNLVFRRLFDAMAAYQQAWRVLQESGAPPEQVARLFGTARPIEPLPADDRAAVVPAAAMAFVAIYDVSERGWPQDIRIEADAAVDTRFGQRAQRHVAGIRHRPRFEGGRAVADAGLRTRFWLRR